MISFCWFAVRVCVVLPVVTLVKLPRASSDQLWLAVGLATCRGTVLPLEVDSVPRRSRQLVQAVVAVAAPLAWYNSLKALLTRLFLYSTLLFRS